MSRETDPGRAVADVIDAYQGNPFDLEPTRWQAADEALAAINPARCLARLLRQGEVERAKLLLLALGHRRACEHPDAPERVFDDALLPPSVRRRLPRPVGDYLRVVMAAGRCYRALSGIRGVSPGIRAARRATWAACFGNSLRHALDLEQVIRDHDILILGETGTGKELFGHTIQVATPGPADGGPAPSAAINAAALPETLVESELFGHAKGAFTGATESRMGRLRSADGGSFFLDEVGDLPSTTQVKLLRVIETNEVFALGSDTPHTVELRYVAATHKDLESLVAERGFRRDLFERLAGNIIRIPPLRERPEDLRAIALPFVQRYLGASSLDAQLARIEAWIDSPEARGYTWPGNVRELQNALRNLLLGLPAKLGDKEREPVPLAAKAALVSRDVAAASAVPRVGDAEQDSEGIPAALRNAAMSMQAVGYWYLRRVVEHARGNLSRAARILGVDRSTVRRRMRDEE
ncbi:sigma 54-interacting transcriptional regulator [Haliangium ochraceum]|nr:sigma 54-interacting transcriptional regulator [Haliangium ochraceum]